MAALGRASPPPLPAARAASNSTARPQHSSRASTTQDLPDAGGSCALPHGGRGEAASSMKAQPRAALVPLPLVCNECSTKARNPDAPRRPTSCLCKEEEPGADQVVRHRQLARRHRHHRRRSWGQAPPRHPSSPRPLLAPHLPHLDASPHSLLTDASHLRIVAREGCGRTQVPPSSYGRYPVVWRRKPHALTLSLYAPSLLLLVR